LNRQTGESNDGSETLLKPSECVVLLVDMQAGLLAWASAQSLCLARFSSTMPSRLQKTAAAFGVPVIATTSASKVYSGPLFPQIQSALPTLKVIERRNMNAWEDDTAREAVQVTVRKRLLVAGLLTQACVSFPGPSAIKDGFEVFVVGDTCGGLTPISHDLALRRLEQAGARLTSWIQVLLEFQRDWTRHDTYEAARAIVVENGGGYGMGLAYALEMIHPI
jgi:nicotinamidase-related amidase